MMKRSLMMAALLCALTQAAHAASLSIVIDRDVALLSVVYDAEGDDMAGIQSWLQFDGPPYLMMKSDGFTPRCKASATSGKLGYFYVDKEVAQLHAIFTSFTDVNPIPSGLLYTCQLDAMAAADAELPACSDSYASDSMGTASVPLDCSVSEIYSPSVLIGGNGQGEEITSSPQHEVSGGCEIDAQPRIRPGTVVGSLLLLGVLFWTVRGR